MSIHQVDSEARGRPGFPYDLLIVGGGINGAGIAREAAGRGLSVILVERDDLASHTSSASTKLIHGGLRYLEYGWFHLVRESLSERERLLKIAPHVVQPMEFLLPHSRSLRPAWAIRTGLFLYDHLSRRKRLPGSRGVSLRRHPAGNVLRPQYRRAFTYSDCRVDDSRLVVLNALDAAERGAIIWPRNGLVSAEPLGDIWEASLANGVRIAARSIVNAAGPWVTEVLDVKLGRRSTYRSRLIKGSHIITRRLHPGEYALILQNTDRRVVFVIPYENEFSLIGTTDVAFSGDPSAPRISPEETKYLCECVNGYLRTPISPSDVVSTYSGVRPLFGSEGDNPSAVTREYVLELDNGGPPVLSVFGGKISDYRRLAERAVSKLISLLGAQVRPRAPEGWTAQVPLPGGDFIGLESFLADFRQRHSDLAHHEARRLVLAYGTRAEQIADLDVGECFGCGLTEAELSYLVKHEWARTPEDVLWRRSKLGLRATTDTVERIGAWLAKNSSEVLQA